MRGSHQPRFPAVVTSAPGPGWPFQDRNIMPTGSSFHRESAASFELPSPADEAAPSRVTRSRIFRRAPVFRPWFFQAHEFHLEILPVKIPRVRDSVLFSFGKSFPLPRHSRIFRFRAWWIYRGWIYWSWEKCKEGATICDGINSKRWLVLCSCFAS